MSISKPYPRIYLPQKGKGFNMDCRYKFTDTLKALRVTVKTVEEKQ